jgi:hypothetical protein
MLVAKQRLPCMAMLILGSGAPVTLFGFPDVKLPAWFVKYDWGVSIRYFTTKLFSQDGALGLTTKDRCAITIDDLNYLRFRRNLDIIFPDDLLCGCHGKPRVQLARERRGLPLQNGNVIFKPHTTQTPPNT